MLATLLSGMKHSAIVLPVILVVLGLCACSSESNDDGWSPTANHVFIHRDSLGQSVVYQSPACFIFDSESDCYFVSNINGDPCTRWDNGYIIKFDRKMALVDNYFIDGRDSDKTLHAPKGMVVRDHILYVADIDAIRGFDVETGKQVTTISLREEFHVAYLNDITRDREGNLYVSDMIGNAVYKIDRANNVSLLTRMFSPSGLCFHDNGLYAVGWERPALYRVSLAGDVTIIKTDSAFKHLDGIDVDSAGQLYFADRTQGVVYRCCPGDTTLTVVVDNLKEPGDISCDRRHGLLMLTHLGGSVSLFREQKANISADSAFQS